MTAHEYVLGLVDTSRQTRRPPVVGMQFLHERAMSTRNILSRGAFLKPKNFVSFILRHHSRSGTITGTGPRVSGAMTTRLAISMSPMRVG